MDANVRLRATRINTQTLPVDDMDAKLVLKAGSLPNSVLNQDGVKALASLPSREELLAKLLGTIQAPVAQFVRTLNEVPTKFVRGLAAVRDKQAA